MNAPCNSHAFLFQTAAASDIGQRANNEDAYLIDEKLGLFVVADGMGGHEKGEVASWFATDHLKSILSDISSGKGEDTLDPFEDDVPINEDVLKYAVLSANNQLFRANEEELKKTSPDVPKALALRKKMGTTLATLFFWGKRAYLSHVGDSRIYRLRGGTLQLMTQDHSVTQRLLNEGKISAFEAKHHAERNVLSRVVGTKPEIEPDIEVLTAYPHERFLLCSDGLSNMIEHDDLQDILKGEDLQTACQQLISMAKTRGGRDNITAVIVEVLPPITATSVSTGEPEPEETIF